MSDAIGAIEPQGSLVASAAAPQPPAPQSTPSAQPQASTPHGAGTPTTPRDTVRLSSDARHAHGSGRDGHEKAGREQGARAHGSPASPAATSSHTDGRTPPDKQVPEISTKHGPLRQGAGLHKADDQVKALQDRLERAGIQTGGADGRFGPQTARAVESFQKKHGLPITGMADEKTIEALNKLGGSSTQGAQGTHGGATTPSREASAVTPAGAHQGAQAGNATQKQRNGIPDYGSHPSAGQLSQQLEAAGKKHGIPENLLKAVAWKESTYGQHLHGSDGHGRGVMQIDNRWHKFARTSDAMNSAANIDYSAQQLLKWKEQSRGGSWAEALGHYNGGTRANMSYAHKVMEYMRTQPWKAVGG